MHFSVSPSVPPSPLYARGRSMPSMTLWFLARPVEAAGIRLVVSCELAADR